MIAKFNPIMLAERNKLIADLLYSLALEQPNLEQTQLLLIAQQFLAKLTETPEPALGSLVPGSVDPETYPFADTVNKISSGIYTDLSGLARWHINMLTYAGTFLRDHTAKLYSEQATLRLIGAELKAAALKTAGLIASEWVTTLDIVDTTFEASLTTATIDNIRMEVIPAIVSRTRADISSIEYLQVLPNTPVVHAGFGKKFGVSNTSTDDAPKASSDYGVDKILDSATADSMEYEIVYSERLKDNPYCDIATKNLATLQIDPTGSHTIGFWWPVFEQSDPVVNVGTVLPYPNGSIRPLLKLQLIVRLTERTLVDRVVVHQNPIANNGPAREFADVTVTGVGPDGARTLSRDTTSQKKDQSFTCSPTLFDYFVITLVQNNSYRQRYELYRYLARVGATAPETYTNLLRDTPIGG